MSSSSAPSPLKTDPPQKRRYPPIYEKVIPVALALIALGIIVLLVIIVIVLAGAR